MAKGLKIMNQLAELVANGKGDKTKPVQKQMKANAKVSMKSDDESDDLDKVTLAKPTKKTPKY